MTLSEIFFDNLMEIYKMKKDTIIWTTFLNENFQIVLSNSDEIFYYKLQITICDINHKKNTINIHFNVNHFKITKYCEIELSDSINIDIIESYCINTNSFSDFQRIIEKSLKKTYRNLQSIITPEQKLENILQSHYTCYTCDICYEKQEDDFHNPKMPCCNFKNYICYSCLIKAMKVNPAIFSCPFCKSEIEYNFINF